MVNKWLLAVFAGALLIGAGYYFYSNNSVLSIVQIVPQNVSASVQVATSSTTKSSNTLTKSTPTTLQTGSAWKTALPVGDYKYTTTGAKKGYIYVCHVASGGEGAEGTPTWISGNTWYPAKKVSVQGAVSWPSASVKITVSNGWRSIVSNDLPVGFMSGIFPIKSSDPAYQFDRNPNTITAQTLSYKLPANPTVASTPGCIYGEVGIMTDGIPLFDGFDAEYRDAAAHETQDSCDAHPDVSGTYHYHSMSGCFKDIDETNILGYAFDGFPITGPKLTNGNYLTTNDLDECHGITSPIMENGKLVTTYHYVLTQDFPYSVGCFRGKSYEPKPTGPTNGQNGQENQPRNQQGSQGGSQPQTPPQAAISACSGKTSGSNCSFSTPNGTISGSCMTPPNQSQVACVPGA